MQIQAGHILLSADTTFATGYDPTGKEVAIYRSASAPGDTSLLWFDTSVGLMKAYVSSAWKVLEGEWYRKTGVAIDATKGIALYGGQVALKTYPTLQNYIDDVNVQCYVGTDGKFYAGAGTVVLDSTGLLFYYGTPKVKVGSVYITDAYVGWLGESGISIILQTSGTADIYVGLTAGRALKPLAGSSIDLGTSALSWHNAYIDHIKNLTDPVDNQDAATKKYVDDSTSGYSDATQTDVTASRTFDVDGNHIYRNTSGKKRLVVITLGLEKSSGAYAHSSVGTPPTDVVATLDSALATGSWLERLLVFMVPKNYYYRVTGTGDSPTTIKWMEWEF